MKIIYRRIIYILYVIIKYLFYGFGIGYILNINKFIAFIILIIFIFVSYENNYMHEAFIKENYIEKEKYNELLNHFLNISKKGTTNEP